LILISELTISVVYLTSCLVVLAILGIISVMLGYIGNIGIGSKLSVLSNYFKPWSSVYVNYFIKDLSLYFRFV